MKIRCLWIVMCCCCWCAGVRAERAETGRPFPRYTLTDQFGRTNALSPETRWVIVASEKDVSGKINNWLKARPPSYLHQLRAEYVSDIEPMPGIITTLFALPKMKKYPFTLLLARDKAFAATYPSEKGKIALFALDDMQVLTSIRFLDTAEEVEQAITASVPAEH